MKRLKRGFTKAWWPLALLSIAFLPPLASPQSPEEPKVSVEAYVTGTFLETSTLKLRQTTVPMRLVPEEWMKVAPEIPEILSSLRKLRYVAVPGEKYRLSLVVEAEEEIERVEVYEVPEEGEPRLVATIHPDPKDPKRVEAQNITIEGGEPLVKAIPKGRPSEEPKVSVKAYLTGTFLDLSTLKLCQAKVLAWSLPKEWEEVAQKIAKEMRLIQPVDLEKEYPKAEPEAFPYLAIPGEEYRLSLVVESEEEIERVEVYEVPEEGEPRLVATIHPDPKDPKRVEAKDIPLKEVEVQLKAILRRWKGKLPWCVRLLLPRLKGFRITCRCTTPKVISKGSETLGRYDVPTCEVVEKEGVKCCREKSPKFPPEERKRVKILEILERPPIKDLLKLFGDAGKLLGRKGLSFEYPTDPCQCKPGPPKCEDEEIEVVVTPPADNPPPPGNLHNFWVTHALVKEFANECELIAEVIVKFFFFVTVTPKVGSLRIRGWRWREREVISSGWISEPCPYPPL